MNEMRRGRGTQFDPDALDAFLRLVEKGVINLEELYAQKRAEIDEAEKSAQGVPDELKRRAEEDKKIQAAEMKTDDKKEDGKGGQA
jgi:energy-coupling factor transport system substrate-specific component